MVNNSLVIRSLSVLYPQDCAQGQSMGTRKKPKVDTETGFPSLDSLVADARFHSLAYAIDEAVVVTASDNLVLFANPAADRLFDASPGGLIGTAFLLPLASLKSGRTALTLPSGQRRETMLSVSATVWDGAIAHLATFKAAPTDVAGVTSDDVEAALSTMRARFLAHLSHELRTPLNTVMGFSETMMLQLFGPLGSQRYVDYAGDIHRAGERLAALVSDLLDLSRGDVGELMLDESLFDLAGLIDELLPEARAEASLLSRNRGAALHADNIAHVMLRGDKGKIARAVQHLIANGLAFTPKGGEVRVSADVLADGRVLIRVVDSGRGFSPEELGNAFRPFPRVKSVDQADPSAGPGVGLALVRRYIELHGGAVRIESVAGEGTTVTCMIPPDRVALDLAGPSQVEPRTRH
jgi:signal transduction histidine kinase